MKIIKEKPKHKKVDFNDKEFWRALLIVIDGDLPIKSYDSEKSRELLNYNRSFRRDFDIVVGILRGTIRQDDVRYANFTEALSQEVKDEILKLISTRKNSKRRIVKSFRPDEHIDIYSFAKAFTTFISFNGKNGTYSSFGLEKSKKLLNYNYSFANHYSNFVSAINGSVQNSIYNKMLENEEVVRVLNDCGFFKNLRESTSFMGEDFASATEIAFKKAGTNAINVKKYSTIDASKEELDYSRSYDKDFLLVQKVLTGYTGCSSIYYSELTLSVEKRIYKIAGLINKSITAPFDMNRFLNFTRNNMDKSLNAIISRQRVQAKGEKDYPRDYAIDRMLVLNALEGYKAPAFIFEALTPKVIEELYSIGFGESFPFNLDDFVMACKKFNYYSSFAGHLSDFDRATSYELLDYRRSFFRDCAYMQEILENKKDVSAIVKKYNTDTVRARLRAIDVPILKDDKKDNKSKKEEKSKQF